MSRSIGKRRSNALADRIAGFDDPSMGDERERDIILRAYTLSAVLSTFVFFALGILFAAIGAGYWSALLMLGPMVGMLAVSIYCKRAGIDFAQSVARIRPIRLTVSYIVSICLALAWLFAMAFHQVNGHPLFPVGLGSTMGNSDSPGASMFGGIIGMVVVIVLITISRYRKRAQARDEAARVHDIDDED